MPRSCPRVLYPTRIKSFLDFCRSRKYAWARCERIREKSVGDLRLRLSLTKIPQSRRTRSAWPVRRFACTQPGWQRSIAATSQYFRNFYRYLSGKSILIADPTVLLVLSKQWQTLPKYLNNEQITKASRRSGSSQTGGAARSGDAGVLYAYRPTRFRAVQGGHLAV